MGEPRRVDPVMLVVAAFSRHAAALDWARARLTADFGPLALAGTPYHFHHTRYYEATMGADLHKQLLAFATLRPADTLPDVKLHTNALEEELTAGGSYPEPRPVNLDPGFLSLGKFVLATVKDQQHRLYLRDGIFAEVTLRFMDRSYEPWPWTYADYQEPAVIAFLNEARSLYREQLKGGQ
ncbi:MAG: DUF4416 family protein [Gemmataceae bacterium]